MTDEVTINRKHKDRLFRYLFGNEKYKKDLLQLYNALSGSNYTDESQLELITIEDVIYMSMKNDVSFLIGSELSLYEHQSTFNPNMPVRGFIYFAKHYDKLLKRKQAKLYGKTLIKLPTPRYYVFYNGLDEHADIEYLLLSDAFEKGKAEGYEWTAVMLNINKGHNKELMERCETLRDYADFVAEIREQDSIFHDINKAVQIAVNKFKHGSGTLARMLADHEAEVMDMCLTEYDEEETMKYLREEALLEGFEQGMEKGMEQGRERGLKQGLEQGLEQGREIGLETGRVMTLLGLVRDGILTHQQAVERSGLSAEAFEQAAAALSENK